MRAEDCQFLYVELPDGRFDKVVASFVPGDMPVDVIHLPIVSTDPAIQSRYESARLDGQSHNFAEIVAFRKFPGIVTDSIFNEGRFSGQDQFAKCPAQGAWLRAEAEKHGVNTTGKYYLSGLADFPGDPTAWVSDRGDVLRVAEAKNLRIMDGYVKHEPHEVEPMPDVEIADDLVEREVDRTMAECPGARREDIRDAVYTLRSGRVDDNPLLVDDYFESDIEATV
jgi:hypothetical protein